VGDAKGREFKGGPPNPSSPARPARIYACYSDGLLSGPYSMLGIILTYFSCPEFLPYQLKNFKKFIKAPYKVLIVDDSQDGLQFSDLRDVCYCRTPNKNNYYGPSGRHQNAVNIGLEIASKIMDCTDFLIFDNDMIFLSDFNLPTESWGLHQKRGNLDYTWMNLIFLKNKTHYFDFARCPDTGEGTDSGGNFKADRWGTQEDRGDGFQYLRMNDTLVVHFGAMSNWNNRSEEAYDEKRRRVFQFLEDASGAKS